MWACIVSNDSASSGRIQRALANEGPEPAPILSLDRAAAQIAELRPALVIVGLLPDMERGLAVVSEIRGVTPAQIVAVGPEGNAKLVLRAMHQGANDYVSSQELESELNEALGRLEMKSLSQGTLGKVIGLLAPSGGSGSSTLAVNIATILAKEHERSVLLDLKLSGGDLAPLLDLKPEHNLAELCQNTGRMDRVMFERCLVRHSSGVHLLPPPPSLRDIGYVTAQGVQQALKLARSLFPYVVIDLDHSFRDEQLQALKEVTTLLLVLRLDFTSLRNTRNTLEHLDHLGISRDRVRLVVNRYGQPKEVAAAKAEEVLGVKIFHFVPEEAKTVNRANNNGVPVVLESPTAWVSRSVRDLAMSVNGSVK